MYYHIMTRKERRKLKTEEILKRIYEDLKTRILSNPNKKFLIEYKIPSINYNSDRNTEDMYFSSGIEMELERMMGQFDNKIHYASYQDRYLFSNDESKLKREIHLVVEKETLREKFEQKIDNEYKEFIEDLKQCTPEGIIDRAYEKVSKQEMIYKIKDRDYSISELKALLKTDEILQECYDEWLKSDGNFTDVLEYAVEERIDLIIEDFERQKHKKDRER